MILVNGVVLRLLQPFHTCIRRTYFNLFYQIDAYLTAYNEEYEHIVLISYEGNSHYNGLLSIEEKVVDKIASDLATYVADPANLEKHEDYEGIMEQISKMKIDM